MKHTLFLVLAVLAVAACNAQTDPLEGKTLCVIGDSYVANHRRPKEETWHYKVAARHHMTYLNFGRNGGCIAWDRSREGFGRSLLERYKDMPAEADYVVVVAGHNDADKIKTSADSLRMFRDSLQLLCTRLIERYPAARIAFVTPWNVPRDGFHEVIQTIVEVCGENGIPVLNAATTSGIHVRNDAFRRRFFQAPNDTAHLNDAGHNLIINWGERFLLSL